MGTYTEIFVKACLKKDIDDLSINVLKYLFAEGVEPEQLPDHKFFSTERWDRIGSSHSYYHIPFYTSSLLFDEIGNCYYLVSRSDLKNYDDEIDLFFDWFKNLVNYKDNFIGYSLCENDREPKLFFS